MDPLKHSESRGIIEGVLRHIPGFRGYLEREYRRESDQMARKHLEERLQTVKQNVDRYLAKQVDMGRLETLAPGERLKSRIDQLQNEIRGSVRGYSGFFDYVQTGRSQLDDVLALDLRLLEAAESIEQAAKILAAVQETSVEKIDELGQTIGELASRYSERSEILNGISQ